MAVDFSIEHRRWRLLEVGAMLADLSHLGDYPHRLASARAYVEAGAELQTWLFLNRAGFAVERDPSNANRGSNERVLEGPDFRATLESVSIAVEVKCLDQSSQMHGRQCAAAEVLFGLGSLSPAGIGLEGKLQGPALATMTNGSWVDKKRIAELVLAVAIDLDEHGVAQTKLGDFRRLASPQSYLDGLEPDHSYEAERLRAPLQKAASQLRALLPDTGVVVLSSARDNGLKFRARDVAAVLEEAWAKEIALVLIMIPTFPGCALIPVPGRRFSELRALRIRGTRVCERGHVHVDSFAWAPGCDGL